MKINIRPMLSKDRPALVKILRHTPEFKPAEVVIAEEVIDSFLGDPQGSGYHVLVAGDDATVVGYICYGPTPLTEGTWDIYWMAVTPEKQGKGIGTALLETAEKSIKKAGGRLAIIETSSIPSYEKTRRFHSRHGYDLVARIPDFYAVGDDKLILQKHVEG
jgi:ribosomal protein S18 acetylase RimI-like enzyme